MPTPTRRELLAVLTASLTSPLAAQTPNPLDPPTQKVQAVIDTDTYNEIDDQQASCSSIQAANSALHPHVEFTTDDSPLPACGQNCPSFTPNSLSVFTVNSGATETGDAFDLNVPQLGDRKSVV